ncbi:MAG: porin family protein [Acidobacteriota bacterium]|nr:porin family protein [Acidobacteriota bacterium]
MKKAVVSLAVILFFCTLVASAQPVGKKWEVGFGLSYSNFKLGDESIYIFNIPFRVGYYVWKGLEIEPEVMLTKIKDMDFGYNLAANVLYNFQLQGNLRPFILAGIGYGNGFAPHDSLYIGESDTNSLLINAGAGVKYLFGDRAAIRVEYRYSYNHLTWDDDYSENVNVHKVLTGISLFF